MSKNCCKITFIPENMKKWAIHSIYEKISNKWNPHIVRKTVDWIITICDERSFSFQEYTSRLDWEGSALLLGNRLNEAIILYRFWIASLLINNEEQITWNNTWDNEEQLSWFEISRQVGLSYMRNSIYDGRSLADVIELVVKETKLSEDIVIEEILRVFPEFKWLDFNEIRFLPENDPWY